MYVFEKENLNTKVGILGLGLSGVSAFRYFKRIGLKIVGWDDSAEVRKNNEQLEIQIVDLNKKHNLQHISVGYDCCVLLLVSVLGFFIT